MQPSDRPTMPPSTRETAAISHYERIARERSEYAARLHHTAAHLRPAQDVLDALATLQTHAERAGLSDAARQIEMCRTAILSTPPAYVDETLAEHGLLDMI